MNKKYSIFVSQKRNSYVSQDLYRDLYKGLKNEAINTRLSIKEYVLKNLVPIGSAVFEIT